MIIRFVVPLPPRELSPNGAGAAGRRWKHPAGDRYRKEVALLAQQAAFAAGWDCPAAARLSLHWGLKGRLKADGRYYGPQDADNAVAAFKAGIDGIVAAGLLAGDTWEHLSLGAITATRQDGPWVEVTLEAMS